jgi:hypothetical protein
MPASERPRATGIAGAVLERSGAPAGGLRIALKARRLFDQRAGVAPPEQTTTTNERGAFAFGSLPDGEYELRTEKTERYDSASALVRAGTDAAVLVVEPGSRASVSIRGVVESASGGAIEGVRVEAIGPSSVSTVSDPRGAYALQVPVTTRLESTALRFRHPNYREERWSIADGQWLSDFDVVGNVRLAPRDSGVSVTGVVTGIDGTPVSSARVQLDSPSRARGYRGVTDQTGRFALAGVDAAADYRLWVRPQASFKDAVLERVVVDAAALPFQIELEPIDMATLRGRMVSPNGAPLAGFTLWLTAAYGATARGVAVTSDAEGRFVVENLPEGPVTLQTRAAPLISVSGIQLRSAASSDITVAIDVGTYRLDGRLLTGAGAPVPGAQLSLEWSTAGAGITSRSSRQTMTDADGFFVFTQIGAGMHTLMTSVAGAGSVRLQQPVGPDMPPLEIRLPGNR